MRNKISLDKTENKKLLKLSQILLTSESHFGLNVNLNLDQNLLKKKKLISEPTNWCA